MKPSRAMLRMPAWNVSRPPSAASTRGAEMRRAEKASSSIMSDLLAGGLRLNGLCSGPLPDGARLSGPGEFRSENQNHDELQHLHEIFAEAGRHLQYCTAPIERPEEQGCRYHAERIGIGKHRDRYAIEAE